MATLLRMTEVAANATHATLAAWSKQPGDSFAAGDALADVETDKAVVEFPAERAGVMGTLLVQAGQEVPVGAPIAVLLEPGESAAAGEALLQTIDASAPPAAQAEPQLVNSESTAPTPAPATAATPTTRESRVFASPLARRIGAQHGVDLSRLQGSGPGGRIVKADVERALAAATAAAPEPPAASFTETPHSAMRRTIARRLSESKSTIPHFYLNAACRMERLLALRAEINATASPTSRKISVNDFIIRAVAVALREVPEANVGWTDTAMRHYSQADIAVAVSTDSGLITPIVRDAGHKSLSQISAEIAELAERARSGRLRPDEYQGGSISVSNLGMYGVDEFSAIINPPQAAILAVGAAQSQPVVENGEVKAGTLMRCTLSVDHRAIDGALAAKWLAEFRRVIEAPLTLLV